MVTLRLVLVLVLLNHIVLQETSAQQEAPHYTAADDASWAVTSSELSSMLGEDKLALYTKYIEDCNNAVMEKQRGRKNGCTSDESGRFRMNKYQPGSVYNYTELGYQKIKAPKKLFDLILEFYSENKHQAETEWKSLNVYHNMWEAPPTIVMMNEKKNRGGGAALQTKIWNIARPLMEEWTGQELSPVSLYGIRLYHNNSILAPHVDRMPLITSAIINVDQDVDEPWPLEVYGHDGKATNITMEPGDMVLYESHSVIHGRPFPMRGNYFANLFIHFEPIGPLDPDEESNYDPNLDIPPYIIPDSVWEKEWVRSNPSGWKGTMLDPVVAAMKGDLKVLKRVGKRNPRSLHFDDANGWRPLHEAVRAGHVEAVKFILSEGADINQVTKTGVSPLNIALEYLGKHHKMTKFLAKNGGENIHPEL